MTIQSFKLTIPGEITLTFLNLGGIIQALHVPDRQGKMGDIVLGFDQKEKYLAPHPYFGGIIGRYANRIKNGSFEIDKRTYHLSKNEGENCLHGGEVGLDKKFWKVQRINEKSYQLSYLSEHLDQGFPGNLRVQVVYSLTSNREFVIDYQAMCDQKSYINLTNHSYFNLSSQNKSILEHELTVEADKYVEVDKSLIPTGTLKDVVGPFDFRRAKVLGKVIPDEVEGIDVTYVLNKAKSEKVGLYDPNSGRKLTIRTTEPGLQVYTGHLLDGKLKGKQGFSYQKHQGICLEPQHYPDSPHHANFPSTALVPKETFRSQTIYQFKAI